MGQGEHIFIVNDFPPIIGGQSAYLYYLCRALPPEKILVLAPSVRGACAFDRAQPFRIVRRPYLARVPVVEKIFKIVLPFFYVNALFKGRDVALLHCAHVLSTGFIGLAMKYLRNTDYVLYTHAADILEYRQHPVWSFFLRKILKEARHVMANSRYTRRQLESLGVDVGKVIVSVPRIDVQEFDGMSSLAADVKRWGIDGRRIILSINRLVPRKGNDVMIRAMPQILRQCPDAVHVIYGDGPCRKMLQELVRQAGLERAVIFLDGKDGDARHGLMAACHVFVMISRAIEATGDVEGFGVVYLEAGAAGKAVVAGNSGGVPDAVEDGLNGLLVDPEDEVAVASAVIKVLDDSALAARLGENGRVRVREKFDYRCGVPELAAVFAV